MWAKVVAVAPPLEALPINGTRARDRNVLDVSGGDHMPAPRPARPVVGDEQRRAFFDVQLGCAARDREGGHEKGLWRRNDYSSV